MSNDQEIEFQNIDHLGIIAGIIDAIGLVDIINKLVGQDPQEKISPGYVVKAMILNGLGFVSSPLYMFPEFFQDKPCEYLIGKGVKAEYLNDDKLGRVMDKLFMKGLTEIFLAISSQVIKEFKISLKSSHLDSTSLHLHGEYNTRLPDVTFDNNSLNGQIKSPNGRGSFDSTGTAIALSVSPSPKGEAAPREKTRTSSPQAIEITYGYSRDHRPDLKQFIIDLISSGDGDIPIFFKSASGNQSDSSSFAKIFLEYKEQMQKLSIKNEENLMVADAALYNAKNLNKQLKYHQIENVNYLEKKLKDNQDICCQVNATLCENRKAIKLAYTSAGRFVLATNILDEKSLSNDDIISQYKAQQSCERGFGFLKDPLFFADSIFLKASERIEAMAMIMGLCLLVYTLAQRQIRTALSASKSTIKNQLGKSVNNPTMRWVFQCFQSIHLVKLNNQEIFISNMTSSREHILSFLPDDCRSYYKC